MSGVTSAVGLNSMSGFASAVGIPVNDVAVTLVVPDGELIVTDGLLVSPDAVDVVTIDATVTDELDELLVRADAVDVVTIDATVTDELLVRPDVVALVIPDGDVRSSETPLAVILLAVALVIEAALVLETIV